MNTDDGSSTEPRRSDAVRALEEAGLLHEDEDDLVLSCLTSAGPFAVATGGRAADLSLAFPGTPDGDSSDFCTHYLLPEAAALVRLALSTHEAPPGLPDLLRRVLVLLDEVASAADVDARLRARLGGVASLRADVASMLEIARAR